jgi:hypothetical protein
LRYDAVLAFQLYAIMTKLPKKAIQSFVVLHRHTFFTKSIAVFSYSPVLGRWPRRPWNIDEDKQEFPTGYPYPVRSKVGTI